MDLNQMSNAEYNAYVKGKAKPSPLGKNILWAFCVGGLICVMGQALLDVYKSRGLGAEAAGTAVSVTLILVTALLTGIGVLLKEYTHINWREFAKMAGVMLVGVLVAQWIAGKVKMSFLLVLYGAVVIGIGVKKLFFPAKQQTSKAIQNMALAIAGIMQGLFVSGGSFLAVYAVDRMPEKQELRATNNALWAILNTVMLTLYLTGGQVDRKVLIMGAIAVIPMVLGVWLGGVFASRIKQQTFLKLVYVILIASGVVLLVSNL